MLTRLVKRFYRWMVADHFTTVLMWLSMGLFGVGAYLEWMLFLFSLRDWSCRFICMS